MAPQARFADVEKEKSEVNQLETIPTGTGTDVDSKDSRYAASTTGLDHKEGVAQAERKLLRKMDMVWSCLPLLAIRGLTHTMFWLGHPPYDSFALCEWMIR